MIILKIEADVIPYVRMTRRGKYVQPDAQRYLSNKEMLKLAIREAKYNQLNDEQIKELYNNYQQTPLGMHVWIERPKIHTCDLDNLGKAVLDACNLILYRDDRWIDHLTITRHQSPTPLLFITLYSMDELLRRTDDLPTKKGDVHQESNTPARAMP